LIQQRVAEESAAKGRFARRPGGCHYEEFRKGDMYEHWLGRRIIFAAGFNEDGRTPK